MAKPAPTSGHRIVIKHEAFGPNFDVVIDPPLPAGERFDRDFPTHQAARGYASGIRMARGFPIFDLVSDAPLDPLLDGGVV